MEGFARRRENCPCQPAFAMRSDLMMSRPSGMCRVARLVSAVAGDAVLPKHPVRRLVDDDDALVEIVRGEDVAVRKLDRERRSVERFVGPGLVLPDDLAVAADLDDLSGICVAGDQEIAGLGRLRIGRVADRQFQVQDLLPVLVELDQGMVADRADEHVAVRQRRVSVRRIQGRGIAPAMPRDARLSYNLFGGRDLKDSAVADVGDDDVAVGELVGVVGEVEMSRSPTRAGRGRRTSQVTVLVGAVDDPDHLLVLQIGDDALAVRRRKTRRPRRNRAGRP